LEDLFPGDLNGVDLLRVDPGASRAESFITTQSRLLPSTFHVKRFSFSLLVSNGWTFSGVIFMAAVWVGGDGNKSTAGFQWSGSSSMSLNAGNNRLIEDYCLVSEGGGEGGGGGGGKEE